MTRPAVDPQSYVRPRVTQLSDDVARYIRDLIMSGSVRGGEYIRVERVAQDMQVSVTPVREALSALRGEGFVSQEPRRGFVVLPIKRQDVQDLFAQQGNISGELAARAVAAMDEAAVGRLQSTQEALEKAAGAGVSAEVSRLNSEFHRIINQASDSSKLRLILRVIVRYSPNRAFADLPTWDAAAKKDHRAIIAALRTGDPEEARRQMEAHISAASQLLLEYLDEHGVLAEG